MDGDVAGNSLSIYSHNVNSLSKHFQEIRTFLNGFKNKFDIVSFTETKLSDDIEQLYRLPNYNSFSLNNKRNSGGLMIYVNDNFEVTTRNDLTYKNDILECIFVEIKLSNSEHVVFGNMYRRPNTSIIDYLNILANILLTLKSESKKVIISGDININLLNCKNNGQIADYVNLFRSHNFLSLINKPTGATNNSCTLIDHVWSNYYSNLIVGAIVYNQISDHFPTISIFNLCEVKQNANIYEFITYRDLSDINNSLFSEELSKISWDLVLNSSNPNIAYDYFSTFICNIFKKCFPYVTKKIKVKYKE